MVEWHVAQSTQRLIETRVARKLGDPGMDGCRADLTAVRRLLDSKSSSAMVAEHKAGLRVACANGLWTNARLAQAGYEVDGMCSLCHEAEDTLFHRWWQCQAPEACAARNSLATDMLKDAATAAGPSSALFTRGIATHPAWKVPRPCSEGGIQFERNGITIHDPNQWCMQGNIFYDGSCEQRGSCDLSRAAWAAVEVNDDGVPTATMIGPVWAALPQTAQSAEYCARTAAVQ
eukprot:8828756-Karenia_brevis.AAC.1